MHYLVKLSAPEAVLVQVAGKRATKRSTSALRSSNETQHQYNRHAYGRLGTAQYRLQSHIHV